MRLVKKTLEQIPMEPCPICKNVPESAKLIMTAKSVIYSHEKLLVVTFYRKSDKRPFCRIFSNKERYITHLYDENRWSKATIDNINAPSDHFYSEPLTNSCVVFIADEKSAAAGRKYFRKGRSSNQNTIDAIFAWQTHLQYEKQAKRDKKDAQITKQIIKKFPPMPKDTEKLLLDGPLEYSRYLFYHRKKAYNPMSGCKEPTYFGYCTHCKTESCLDFTPKHNGINERCPHCGSIVTTKAWRISRKHLIDRCDYLVFSKNSAGAVFARYLLAERDYSGQPEKVTTNFIEKERYYFAKDTAYRFWPVTDGMWQPKIIGWKKKQIIAEPTIPMGMGCIHEYWIHPFSAKFFDDTDLRHSHLADYLQITEDCYSQSSLHINCWNQTPIEYLAAFCKHPNIEHLMDSGLFHLLQEKLQKTSDAAKAIDLNHSRPRDMLGISQPEVQMVKKYQLKCRDIVLYRECKAKLKRPMDAEDITIIRSCGYDGKRFSNMEQQCGTRRLFSFLKKQKRRHDAQYHTYNMVLGDWVDYLAESRELHYNTKQENILCPPDLHKAHQKTSELLRQKREEEARLKSEAERALYRERLKNLKNYTYVSKDSGLLIRAAQSRQELVDEGASLSHCVGGYASRHLKGETTILFIRTIAEPDKSYFTLEFEDGRIAQNRGYENCDPPENVKQFAKNWYKKIALPLWNKEQKAAKKACRQNNKNHMPAANVA